MTTPAAAAPTDSAVLAPDMVPAQIHDPAEPTPFAAPVEPVLSEPAAEPEVSEPAPPPSVTAREAIAAKFRAKREEHEAQFQDKGETPPFIEHAHADPVDPVDPAAAEPVQPDTAHAQPQTFNVKVRGQTYSATREQLIQMAGMSPEEADGLPASTLVRAAQIVEAGKSYLDEAKTQLQGARSAAHAPVATPAANQQPAADLAADPLHGDTDPLREAIERIQYGDPDEASAALRRAIEADNAKREAQRAEQDRLTQLRADGDSAIAQFSTENPDITTHPVASDLLLTQSVREIANDFMRLGASQEQVAPLLANPQFAYKAYTEARMKGLAVRAPADMLAAAGQTVRGALGIQKTQPNPAPAPQNAMDNRVAAKRALPQQPQRSVAAPAQASAPPPPSRSQAIMQMRKARGQSAVA